MRIALYSPNDIVPLARQIVDGKLVRPFRRENDYFPPLMAYEHKYGYKLKFLTDNNITVLGMMSVTNVVVVVEESVECSCDMEMRNHGIVILYAHWRVTF